MTWPRPRGQAYPLPGVFGTIIRRPDTAWPVPPEPPPDSPDVPHPVSPRPHQYGCENLGHDRFRCLTLRWTSCVGSLRAIGDRTHDVAAEVVEFFVVAARTTAIIADVDVGGDSMTRRWSIAGSARPAARIIPSSCRGGAVTLARPRSLTTDRQQPRALPAENLAARTLVRQAPWHRSARPGGNGGPERRCGANLSGLSFC